MNEAEELRALIREVIRDQLGSFDATESVESVDLSTDDALAAFVSRLLSLDEAERDALQTGRKRFRLASPSGPIAPLTPLGRVNRAIDQVPSGGQVRRVERGAVTERMVRDCARAGERLVLGPGAVLTPLAKDRARTSGVEIEKER